MSGGGGGNAQSLQAYDPGQDHYIFVYQEEFRAAAIAGQITGGSIQSGASISIQDIDHEAERWQVVTLGDSDAIAVYTDTASNWTQRVLQARVITRSGLTLSLGTGEGLISDGGSTGLYHDMHIIELDGQTAFLVYGDRASGLYRTLTNNSGSLIVGTEFDFMAGSNANSWFTGGTRAAKLDTNKDWIAIVSSSIMQYTDPHEPIQAWLVNTLGASATNFGPFTLPGSPNFSWSQSIDMVDVGTDRFVVVYEKNTSSSIESAVGRRSGSAIDFSDASAVALGGYLDFDLFPIDSSNVGLAFTTSGINEGLYIRVGTLDGGSVNWSSASGFSAQNDVVEYMMNTELYNSSQIIGGFEGEDNQLVLVSGSLTFTAAGGGSVAQALGMDISGAGTNLYVTSSDGSNLNLDILAAADLSTTSTISLGQGTWDETNASTFVAYPRALTTSHENFCYVYGRMLNPGGTSGSVTHLIKTEDKGATFTGLINTWGADHCGAMIRKNFNYPFMVRNIAGANVSVLYVGASTIGQRALAPFHVNPGGIDLTGKGIVVIGAAKPHENAIRYASPPWSRWSSLKGYQNSGSVTGLTVV